MKLIINGLKAANQTQFSGANYRNKSHIVFLFEWLKSLQRLEIIDQIGGKNPNSCTNQHVGQPMRIVGHAQNAGCGGKQISAVCNKWFGVFKLVEQNRCTNKTRICVARRK